MAGPSSSDRLAWRQISPQSDPTKQLLKNISKPAFQVEHIMSGGGRNQAGFAIFEFADNAKAAAELVPPHIDTHKKGHTPADAFVGPFPLAPVTGTSPQGQGIGTCPCPTHGVRPVGRENHGPPHRCASELHSGSTFTITLPIQWNTSKRNRDS